MPFAVIEGFDEVYAGGQINAQSGQLCISGILQTTFIHGYQFAADIQ